MIKASFEFTIVSAFDREKLTCEIIYKNELFAEISQETDMLLLEIYPPKNDDIWVIPLEDLQAAIEYGKKFLKGEVE